IISSNDDISTNEVIDWIDYYGAAYKRISADHPILVHQLSYSEQGIDLSFSAGDHYFKWDDIQAVWYRRSYVHLTEFNIRYVTSEPFDRAINHQLFLESKLLHEAFWNILGRKSINTEQGNQLNKLVVLERCRHYGISIPESLVTSSKKDLIHFFDKHRGNIITKNFSPGIFIRNDHGFLSSQTQMVTKEMIESMDDFFHPVLVQQNISKAFELRIFFLLGEFYASAIFSQNDKKTQLDFRNYNWEKPNRTPTFQLPYEVQHKLAKLMNHIDLNSGSIDMLVDKSGNYFFLEVNPVGQFKQVSAPCNYNLEKIIAEKLINGLL